FVSMASTANTSPATTVTFATVHDAVPDAPDTAVPVPITTPLRSRRARTPPPPNWLAPVNGIAAETVLAGPPPCAARALLTTVEPGYAGSAVQPVTRAHDPVRACVPDLPIPDGAHGDTDEFACSHVVTAQIQASPSFVPPICCFSRYVEPV